MTEPKVPHMTVTPAEVKIARLHIELAEMLGEEVSPAIRAIAAAVIPADKADR